MVTMNEWIILQFKKDLPFYLQNQLPCSAYIEHTCCMIHKTLELHPISLLQQDIVTFIWELVNIY